MPTPLPTNPLSRHRYLIDFGIRAALSLTFALIAGGCLSRVIDTFKAMDAGLVDPRLLAEALSTAAIGLYCLVISGLYAIRLSASSSFAGTIPCAAALLGSFLLTGLVLLNPCEDLSLTARLAGFGLVTIGNIFTVVCLLRLGKSFSMLPEGRRLVTTGPYKFVRHPVYLAEAVTALGVMIHVLSVWAILLVAVQIGLQILRMHYEEKVLRESFPEYEDYARKTARLIPGIY